VDIRVDTKKEPSMSDRSQILDAFGTPAALTHTNVCLGCEAQDTPGSIVGELHRKITGHVAKRIRNDKVAAFIAKRT
jgi:hypothetical protein